MTCRILKAEDSSQVISLWDYCFEKKDSPFSRWFFSESFRPDRTLGSFQGEKLKAMLNLAPYTLRLKEADIAVSYIVGIATWPEYRGKGEIKKLLKEAFWAMREWGEPLAILMPSRPEFYYPFDFQLYHHRLFYQVLPEELRRIAGVGMELFEATEAEAELLKKVADNAFSSYEGRTLRSREKWRSLLKLNELEGGRAYLIGTRENPTGYFFYTLNDSKLKISDWAAATSEALAGMAQFIYQHRAQAKTAEWMSIVNDPFQFLLPETKGRAELFPFMTSRIADVEKLIPMLRLSGFGEVNIQIKDDFLEWNSGIFNWKAENGKSEFVRRDNEKPDLEITIGGLAQWLFGQMDSKTLQVAGFLKTHKPEKAILLDRWLPRSETYINEYF